MKKYNKKKKNKKSKMKKPKVENKDTLHKHSGEIDMPKLK